MRTIREIMRLHFEHNLSQRAIARACGVSPTTVGYYIERIQQSGREWAAIRSVDDGTLKSLVNPEGRISVSKRPFPDFDYLDGEMKKKGVTLQLLWEEYRFVHPDGYGRSQFCELYRRHLKSLDPVMRFSHKAGDKMFVDFSGECPFYTDVKSGKDVEVELFVAVMGASSRTYAVAVENQQIPQWTRAHIGAFEFFGGTPACVVPDQLKSGVKTPCKYDPEINPAYAELCAHYGVAVVPARPRKARDKAKVESGVLNAQRRILAVLRNRSFFSLAEINKAIVIELQKLNDRPMQGIGKSRNQLFNEIDKPALKPLPAERFQARQWKKARVHLDYHVAVEGSWYSVSYTLIGKEVEICVNTNTVEIFLGGKRVASHPRTFVRNVFITDPAHRPHSHREHLNWTPERIREWGKTIGVQTTAMIEAIIKLAGHPEEVYRKCLGLLRLSRIFGADRLELACARALKLGAIGYRSIRNMLHQGLETADIPEDIQPSEPLLHDNLRGAEYYEGGVQ